MTFAATNFSNRGASASLVSKARSAVAPRYQQATHSHKSIILDEFVPATGYARKYAILLLTRPRHRTQPRQVALPKLAGSAGQVTHGERWDRERRPTPSSEAIRRNGLHAAVRNRRIDRHEIRQRPSRHNGADDEACERPGKLDTSIAPKPIAVVAAPRKIVGHTRPIVDIEVSPGTRCHRKWIG